jgi:hypothetical protein
MDKTKKMEMKRLLIVLVSVIFLIGVLVTLSNFTGFVAVHEGLGGRIYGINLLFKQPAINWAAIYGAAFGVNQEQPWEFTIAPGSLTEANVFFQCLRRDSETLLFASTVPESQVIVNSLVAATPAIIDQYIGIDNTFFDSATNTFLQTMTIDIGGRIVNNVPIVNTRVGTGTQENILRSGVLIDDDDNIVIVAPIIQSLVRGFNDRFYNYQMLIPIPNSQTQQYYFFLDPFIICPEGDADDGSLGILQGIVTDASGNVLDDVVVTAGRFSGVTNAVGFYNFTTDAGQVPIFAIKTGYKVFSDIVNITVDDVTVFNIVLEIETPPNEFTDIGPDFGPDVGPGQDVGPGEVAPRPEQPLVIEGQDYWLPFDRIIKKIRQGEFSQERILIQSLRNGPMNVDFRLEGNVSNLTTLDTNSLSIGARGEGRATITFFGNSPPGIYNGTLFISGDINEEIYMEIEILDRDRIPIQALLIGITMSDRTIYSGSAINFRTDLTNLLSDREYPVQLYYTIQNIEGTETIWTDSANTFLRTSMSLIKGLTLPSNLPPGDYVLRANARYLDLTSSTSYAFRVDLPFYQYMLFGKLRVWQAGLILLILTALTIAGVAIKRNIDSKKKYKLKVEYSELPKPGPRNIFVGKIAETDHKTYMNLENFKTHTIVAGSTGGGKSFSAQVIIEEMLMKDVAVIVFDPTAQWTGYLRKLQNKGLMALYPNFGMKPEEARAFTGNIRQINNSRELLDIRKFAKPGEINIFALHKLDPKEMDVFVANTVREVFHANFEESDPLKICLVYDEVHRLLPKFGGSGQGFLQIERACREFRKWGIGVMLISQVLADFVGQIKANINTEVQMRTRDEGDLDRIKTKYGEDVLQSLVKASVGTGMVQNSAYNRGRPYFTTFRPILHSVERLSDDEIASYNEYNEQIDQINFELDQLEELKQDVFDLRLELKLALDKVKSGNFNMVKIYLEGLTPRIEKFWTKLGQKPKKLEKKLVSEEALDEEAKKAKEGREKFEAENKTEDKKEEKKEDPAANFKKDVAPDKILSLKNGMLVVNPATLYSELEAMKDADFEAHVNETKNDFADWFKNAVGDMELSTLLSETKDKSEILKLLEMRGKGEKLPAPKNKPAEPVKEEVKAEAKPETAEPAKEEVKEPVSEEKPQEEKPETSEPVKEEVKEPATEENKESVSEEKPAEEKVQTSEPVKEEVKEETKEEAKSQEETAVVEEKPQEIKEEAKPLEPTVQETEEEVNKNIHEPAPKEEGKEEEEETNNYDLKEVLERKAFGEFVFKLENGHVLHSLKDLRDYLEEMPEELFYMHVNHLKNDFANWTKHVFGEEDLAEKMFLAKNKLELLEVLING